MARLPVLQPKIRPSRAARWRAGVLIAVHVLIALHITHWLITGSTVTPVEPSEAMAFTKSDTINAGLVFFAAAILLTAVFGRWFCGWACHLVALQDLARWLLLRIGIRPVPLRSRLLRLVPVIAFVYMFLWPVAYRLWIGDSFGHFETEFVTSEFWATFPGLVIGALTFLICGFVIIYFLGAKGFCTYACPYGAIFAAAEQVAPMRIRVTDACAGCAHCTAVCSSNVRVHEEVRDFGMVVSSDCMKCQDCVSVCPNDALYYGRGPIPLLATPRDGRPGRPVAARSYPLAGWEEGLLAVAFVAAFLTFRGLYGQVPFLMSLGLAAVLAYLVLLGVRLATREHLASRRFPFKRGGRLLPAGRAFALTLAVLAAFWGHSALVRYHHAAGERAYLRTAPLRLAAADVSAEPTPLTATERVAVARALDHLESVEELGLFPTVGNDRKLAWLYLLTGDSENLDRRARREIERHTHVSEMHQLLAGDAWRRGDLGATVAAYEQAIATEPDAASPYLSLSIVLARGGDLAAAENVLERGLNRFADDPRLIYNAGLVRVFQGDSTGGIALFERALAVDARYLEARENLAGMLASVGRFEDSIVHYRLALEQAPEDAETRLLLARALAAAGHLAEAEEELQETLRLDPERREAWLMLGDLAAERGDRAEAERLYARADST